MKFATLFACRGISPPCNNFLLVVNHVFQEKNEFLQRNLRVLQKCVPFWGLGPSSSSIDISQCGIYYLPACSKGRRNRFGYRFYSIGGLGSVLVVGSWQFVISCEIIFTIAPKYWPESQKPERLKMLTNIIILLQVNKLLQPSSSHRMKTASGWTPRRGGSPEQKKRRTDQENQEY